MKWPIRFLAVLTSASLVGASLSYSTKDSDQAVPSFIVNQADVVLSDVPSGDRELVVKFTNPANFPRSIIGISEGCAKNCCYFSKHNSTIIVGAGETVEYRLLLRIYRTGQIDAEIKIYLEDNGIRTVTLHVTGTAIKAPNVPNP